MTFTPIDGPHPALYFHSVPTLTRTKSLESSSVEKIKSTVAECSFGRSVTPKAKPKILLKNCKQSFDMGLQFVEHLMPRNYIST